MISDEINTDQIHDPMDEEIHDTIEEVVNSDREEAQRAIEAARTLTSLNTEETDENDNDYKILNGYGVVCPWNDLLNSFNIG